MQAKRLLGNVGTCVPHADGNQPQIVTPNSPPRRGRHNRHLNLVRAHDADNTIWNAGP
jgi:hypothetical protein